MATKPDILAWIRQNHFVTETGKPFEFVDHGFLKDILTDLSPRQVIKKSAQNGISLARIIQSAYLTDQYKLNIAHILPDKKVVESFVVPKVNPLIANNPVIADRLVEDNKGLKGFDKDDLRFIYYRGAFSQKEAINFSADLLIYDEYDRCDQSVLTTYKSRTQASEYDWKWYFSNPSEVGFGVDSLYEESDQMHWFITCHHCSHEWYLDFDQEEDDKRHYVKIISSTKGEEQGYYACGNCHEELSRYDRTFGRWVAKYPARKFRGYWISQLIAPWVKAEKIIEDSVGDPKYFHNFVLGKAYTPTDLLVDRQSILRATSPGTIAQQDVVMGVDNGIVKHYVIGTPNGIFRYGDTKDWDEIRSLIRLYNMSCVVIDHNPYPVEPKRLVKEFPGKVFLNFYEQDKTGLSTIRWGKDTDYGIIKADRTKIIDQVASEIAQAKLIFRQSPYELEEYIAHWASMYRQVVENTQGIKRGEWLHQEGKPDHLAHATIYFRIALEKAFGGFGQVVKQSNVSSNSKNLFSVNSDGSMKLNLDFKKAYAKKRTIR